MIYITDTVRISKVDENCLQIETYVSVTSKKTRQTAMQWKWVGYYGDLRSALVGAFKKQLFDTADEELQLKDIIERIDAAVENIKNAHKEGDSNEDL